MEAIIRISESMAKMRLEPFASESDVDEALRLFTVSTLSAAMSGSLAGELVGVLPFTEHRKLHAISSLKIKHFQ